ncbi:hypothetical protein DV711_06255 [Motiliproteus coralliicola]|uniref:Carbon storage regulator n=1 Tax=Motiliproteus coralliicola TaxID=2283196 RepID=A0A369X055_9GAMM|nr:carbon storage regulator [Motiliproteus coralliicola]RDE25155.1 hypothetical protein DV711_06255 [Motiliproteus coralliicola]
MLILNLAPGEEVIVDPDGPNQVIVTSLDKNPKTIALGFTTLDQDVPVYRRDLYERLKAKGNKPKSLAKPNQQKD